LINLRIIHQSRNLIINFWNLINRYNIKLSQFKNRIVDFSRGIDKYIIHHYLQKVITLLCDNLDY